MQTPIPTKYIMNTVAPLVSRNPVSPRCGNIPMYWSKFKMVGYNAEADQPCCRDCTKSERREYQEKDNKKAGENLL